MNAFTQKMIARVRASVCSKGRRVAPKIAVMAFAVLASITGPAVAGPPSEKIGTAALLTPTQVDSYYGTATQSSNGLGFTSRPPEVVELARALAGNSAADPANPTDANKTVDRIYQYVRNNVEVVWLYGLQKGAVGAIVDRSGTAFDQAMLMVELLRQAGYSGAGYQVGTITLTGQQFYDWSGVQNAQAACQLLANGSIGAVINGSTDPTCAAYAGTTVSSITLSHIWVSVPINGTTYLFDPAYKIHVHKAGTNLASTAQMTSGQPLAQATTNMVSGTDSATGQSYVQSLNTTALYSTIQTYGQNLLAYIRQHPELQLEDIVGIDVIARYETPTGGLTQTSLPYAANALHSWSGAVPDQYRTTLEVNSQVYTLNCDPAGVNGCGGNYGGQNVTMWDKTLFVDEIYGRKLVVNSVFDRNSSATWAPTLNLVDETGAGVGGVPAVLATYNQLANTSNPLLFRAPTLTLTVKHPYAASADGTATTHGDYMSATIVKNVDATLPLVIVNAWGDANGLVTHWGTRDDTNLPKDILPSGCETCTPVPGETAGDGRREKFAANWIVQSSKAARLHAAIGGAIYQLHHSVGVVSADIDVGLYSPYAMQYYRYCNCVYTGPIYYHVKNKFDRFDVESAFSLTSKAADPVGRRAAIHAIAATTDALEGSVVGQMADLPDATSTATRFEWGNAPPSTAWGTAIVSTTEDVYSKGPRRFFTFTSSNASAVSALAKVEGRNDYSSNDPCGASGGMFGYAQPGTNPPQMCASEAQGWMSGLQAAVNTYAQAQFTVVTTEEAHLGPGQPFGSIFVQQGTANGGGTVSLYTTNPSFQRGGSLIATRYVNGDPVEIAHVAVSHTGALSKGGGGGVQTDHAGTFNPAEAADILKAKFVDHSKALGVDLANGEPTYSSPELSVGNGEFPDKLTAQMIWRTGQATAPSQATPKAQPSAPWTSNWSSTLSMGSSGLEAMGASDTRAAAGTLAAFIAIQDIYKASPATSRDVAGVLANAWWVRQISGNTVTATFGASTKQFVKLVDGSFISPGSNEYAVLAALGTPQIMTNPDACSASQTTPPYLLSRGWDYSAMSFTVTGVHGDRQTFPFWRNEVSDGASYCNVAKGFRLSSWSFPKGVTVNLSYGPNQADPNGADVLLSVSNSLGRQINFINSGVADIYGTAGGFNNNLSGADARSINATSSRDSSNNVTFTFTDQAGYQTSVFATLVTWFGDYGGGLHYLLSKIYTPDNATTPHLQYDYDSLRRVMRAWDANALQLGNRQPYQFFISNKVRGERQDPAGGSFAVEYDQWQRPLEYFDELGRQTILAYDGRNRVTGYTYPERDQEQIGYNDQNNITSLTKVAKPGSGLSNIVVSATWDPTWNKVASLTDPLGKVTTFTYVSSGQNGAGEMLTATRPAPSSGGAQPVYSFTYGVFGRPATATDPTGVVTQNAYDGSGNLTSATVDPGASPHVNSATQFAYDANGELTQTTGPNGSVSNVVYDLDGRKLFEIAPTVMIAGQPSRLTVRHVYDVLGREIETDKGTATTATASDFAVLEAALFTYDPVGNKLSAWTPTAIPSGQTPGQVTPAGLAQMNYDPLNRVLCSAVRMNPAVYGSLPDACTLSSQPTSGSFGADRITKTVYDAAGQKLQEIRAFGTARQYNYSTYTYTLNGKQQTVLDANSNLTTYVYDGFDRLITTKFPSSALSAGTSDSNDTEAYTYDASGNRLTLTKRDGSTLSWCFDALNRETTKYLRAISGGCSSPPAPTGNDVQTTYDLAGRTTAVKFASSGQGVVYAYDTAGRLTGETTGGLALSFGLDAAGNRTKVTWPDGFYAGYVFDAMNRVTAVNENGAISGAALLATYAFDTLGRKTTIARGNGTITSFGYDVADRMSSLAQSIPNDTAHNQTLGFAYSPASQLVTRTWTNQAYSWFNHPTSSTTAAYDGLNRDASIATTAPTNCPTTALAPNAGYDCNGNQLLDKAGVRHFAYDIENRLTQVTGLANPVSLSYDPLGRLQTYTVGSTTPTTFLYEGSRLVAEYSGTTLVNRYVHGPGVDDPLVWYQGSGVTSRNWLHMDRQGSVIATSNAAGTVTQTYAYGPYGEPQAWGGSRFAYTGQIQLPELQLYHYKARAYDPVAGRFLQTDPIGYKDDNDLYAYVGEDPLDKADPTGTETWQFGVQVNLGLVAYEGGNYKEQDPNNWVTWSYPTETGSYSTKTQAADHTMGFVLGVSVNLTHCGKCTGADLEGNGKGFEVAIGPITAGRGETSGKKTETIGFGVGAGYRPWSKSYTRVKVKTGERYGHVTPPESGPGHRQATTQNNGNKSQDSMRPPAPGCYAGGHGICPL